MRSTLTGIILAITTLVVGAGLLQLPQAGAQGEAYCYITAVETSVLSNGVQINVKADGILTLDRDTGDQWER